MRVVIQKSGNANVKVDGKITGQIDGGLVILLGIAHDDTEMDIDILVEKISNLRLFPRDETEFDHKYFDKSLLETWKQALVISQFTLYANCDKGRRPDFNEAAKSDIARPLYDKFLEKLAATGVKVEAGIFAAIMDVSLVNEGPVTIILNSKQ